MPSHKPKTYFEGVLQLRNPSQKIVDYVADEIDRKEGVWIAKTARQKNGVDLYLSSNRFLKEIGGKLKQRFPGELKLTSTLYTRNHLTQKEVHRGCVLFRHYDLSPGDVITLRGEEIEVQKIGAEILGKSRETGKKVHVKFSQLKDARI